MNRPRAVFKVTDSNNNEPNDTSAGLDVVENLMKRLLPSPAETSQETAPFRSDYELLAQRLCEMAQPPLPGNSDTVDIEHLLRRLLPVASVVEEATQPVPESRESTSGCFSCGSKNHTTSGCGVLNESFPFLPADWQVGRQDNECMLRPPRREVNDPTSGNVA